MLLPEYEHRWTAFMEECTGLPFVVERLYSFDVRPMAQAFINGVLVFADGARLHFREFVDVSDSTIVKLSYSYHAHDAQSNLIIRYDNAPHKPPLGFEEHKHLSDGTITPATAPTIEDVFVELIQARNYC